MNVLWHIKRIRIFITLLVSLMFAVTIPVFANTNSNHRTIPFEQLEYGQYTIEVVINDVGPLKFMIDTAASRSSIFESTRQKLGLEKEGPEKFISGMTTSSYRPVIQVRTLSFGENTFFDHTIVVLKDWEDGQNKGIDGILGMDVINNLVFAFSHKSATVKISKRPRYIKSKYTRWQKVRLEDNPYLGDRYGLKFTYAKLGDLKIPTLLDTGANFSAINWMSIKGSSISRERRRLRKEWIVQGAVGEFKPRLRVRLERIYIGGIRLKQHEFLVMDFDKFPINNYGKYPLVIAGIDFMDGRDFVLDFVNNYLYIAATPKN